MTTETKIGEGLHSGETYTEKLGDEPGVDYVVTSVTPTSFSVERVQQVYKNWMDAGMEAFRSTIKSMYQPVFFGRKRCFTLRSWKAYQMTKRFNKLPNAPYDYTVIERK